MLKIKKALLTVALVFLSCSIWAQNLRNYVCIVRGNLSQENKEFLTDLEDALESYGHSRYAKYIDSFLTGTFGSGFVWYGPDSKPYIVTNRHVAGGYESADITFENADGSVTEFKDLKIVFSDSDVDIALIELPSSFNRAGLLFTSKKLTDGEDVFSAGFPGLGGEPGWQFGKGIVSNSSARIKDLIDPEISTLIQHTAQVDGGNSGGPLLIKDANAKAGYRVCGVNTWTAVARQNTNFAIPVSTIDSIVKTRYIKKTSVSFDARSAAFLKAIKGDDYSAVVPFISNDMVSKSGETALKEVLTKAPSAVYSSVSAVFVANPIEGLRYALAYKVYSTVRSDNETTEIKSAVDETKDSKTGKSVAFATGDVTINSFWIEEQGTWKIFSADGIKAATKKDSKKQNSSQKKTSSKDSSTDSSKDESKKSSSSSVTIEDPYMISVAGGFSMNIKDSSAGFEITALYRSEYFSFGACIMKDVVVTGSSYEIKVMDYGPMLTLSIPIKTGNFLIVPFAEGKLGIVMPDDKDLVFDLGAFYSGIGGGIEVAYCLDSIAPYAGVKYNATFYNDDYSGKTLTTNHLVIFAGIRFFSY